MFAVRVASGPGKEAWRRAGASVLQNIVTRLTLHQDDAGVIAQTRTVGERADVIEQALGGGVGSRKMFLKTHQPVLFIRWVFRLGNASL